MGPHPLPALIIHWDFEGGGGLLPSVLREEVLSGAGAAAARRGT